MRDKKARSVRPNEGAGAFAAEGDPLNKERLMKKLLQRLHKLGYTVTFTKQLLEPAQLNFSRER